MFVCQDDILSKPEILLIERHAYVHIPWWYFWSGKFIKPRAEIGFNGKEPPKAVQDYIDDSETVCLKLKFFCCICVCFFLIQEEPVVVSQRFWGRNLLHQISQEDALNDSSDGSTQYSDPTPMQASQLGDSSDGSTQFSEPTGVPGKPLVVNESSTSGEDFFADDCEEERDSDGSARLIQTCSTRPDDYSSPSSYDSAVCDMDDIGPRSPAETQELPNDYEASSEVRK